MAGPGEKQGRDYSPRGGGEKKRDDSNSGRAAQ